MNRFPFHPISATLLPLVGAFTLGQSSVMAESTLHLAYPPNNHQTTASKIFLIGTAPPTGTVLVNGQAIARSTAGHFAPSLPLQLGANQFILNYGSQQLQLTVTRLPTEPPAPVGATFVPDSLTPAVNIARLPNEPICFSAIAPANATVSVKLADQTIPLEFQPQRNLPPNSAVLTGQNQPVVTSAGKFQGCVRTVLLGDLGQPEFQLTLGDRQNSQVAPGSIQILSPEQLEVAEVTVEQGTARTGPSTDYSRLTPLPKGTQAVITGVEGEWLRLDYGAWIKRSEVQIRKTSVPPNSMIRSVKAKQVGDWTEVLFPLQVPVPVSVQQGDRSFTLTLYNTTAQTDTIKLDDDPLIARLDWQQTTPGQVQYRFNLKTAQQWGYKLRYEGSSLILSLKHPPQVNRGATTKKTALAGVKILLDPGHGGDEDTGSAGPTGYPEKNVALIMSKLVRDRLVQRGATVVMTREQDVDVPLLDRVNMIQKVQPAIALSLHYNALPDDGDAIKTQGVSTYWYQAQAHSLAVFLHNYLVKTLDRPSYGVFWNNLALTRPAVAPSVLLELGFMINPTEFEWITNAKEQQRLATAIADGITEWVRQAK
ncbi:N-acetylmuramoyl-L-alanine amidase [Pantanalinema sp. GBBB05]|uniref:N-acetylmuramoyl-L-alanine amidase n=1 Tax=Pantanalinema sp. GBBB05 TaxID=2604139 RepID=UPI001DF6B8B0|nr:N-acetylmuramoyl-L-alanine amidase [Pantanalinema sp. GBBB05]